MRRYLWIILLFCIIASEIACVSNRSFFQNKVLVYNSEVSGDFSDTISNASFIDYYKDTLNFVDYPLNLFEAAVPSLDSTLFPYSDIHIVFKRRKKNIYIHYAICGKSYHMKYFKVSKKDSVKTTRYDALCHANETWNDVITSYAGKDTTIDIPGKHAQCWVFKIEYPNVYPPNERIDVLYIEKKTLLPVQKITTFWFFDQNTPPIFKTGVIKSRIVQVLKRPWDSANRRWRYMPCYYK